MHVYTNPLNEYGERVVANVIYNPENGDRHYRCDPPFWKEDFAAWVASRHNGGPELPQPMSEGHCMFLDPLQYGCLPEGETRSALVRRAIRHSVLAMLDGWDRELRKTNQGMRKLAAIVRATVRAKMEGVETGGAPFVACVWAGIA